MRAAIIRGPGMIRLDEVDAPAPGPGEVLVRVIACGLCTTDLDILDGRFWGSYPIVPGHGISGVVETVGDGVSSLRSGDFVAVDPNIPCGRCDVCRSGLPHLCTSLRAVGVT
jgi:D-arabinose 1-dehydrogenase-like Zn-dependent alcohol dehydrogenase